MASGDTIGKGERAILESQAQVWRCGGRKLKEGMAPEPMLGTKARHFENCDWVGVREELVRGACPVCKSEDTFPALDGGWNMPLAEVQ